MCKSGDEEGGAREGARHCKRRDGTALAIKPDGSYTHSYKDDHGREHTVNFDRKTGTMVDEYEERVGTKPYKRIVTTERDGKETTKSFVRDKDKRDWDIDT